MSSNGVTEEEIIKVCNMLRKNNDNPTIDKVRQALGNRGSNTTISKYLGWWKRGMRDKGINPSLSNEFEKGYNKAILDMITATNSLKRKK